MKKPSLPKQVQKFTPIESFGAFGLKGISRVSLRNFFTTYFIPIIIGVALYFPTNIFKSYPDKTFLYIAYLIIVSICVNFGGLTAGLLSTAVILIGIFFSFELSSLQSLLNAVLFASGSVLMSIMIDRAHKAQELHRLKEKERKYAQSFLELHDRFLQSQGEIKARDEFLSVVSHELRTPLTTTLLKLRHMLDNVRNISLAKFSVPELIKVLRNAEEQIVRLSEMINDLVNVSLITTGRMNLHTENCDLNGVTKHVLQSFSELIKKGKYKVTVDTKTTVTGKWDKIRIEQAITNLVSNAIKYGKGKPIHIQISGSGATAKFIIEDQGIGISNQNQHILFDLFKRAHGIDGYKEGLGVGLYITAQIVKAHGGHIKVSSTTGKGSSFTIELPLKMKRTLINEG